MRAITLTVTIFFIALGLAGCTKEEDKRAQAARAFADLNRLVEQTQRQVARQAKAQPTPQVAQLQARLAQLEGLPQAIQQGEDMTEYENDIGASQEELGAMEAAESEVQGSFLQRVNTNLAGVLETIQQLKALCAELSLKQCREAAEEGEEVFVSEWDEEQWGPLDEPYEPEPPGETVAYIKLATLGIPNLQGRSVAICSPDSQCFNEASAGWVGSLSPEMNSMQVSAGRYKLKFGNYYLQDVVVEAGQPTEIQVGTLRVPNLSGRTVAVCSPDSQCFNTASGGWAGVVTPKTKSLELPAGSYKLKFDEHYLDGVTVTAGQPTEIHVGTLRMPNLSGRTVAVCSPDSRCFNTASSGWAGVLSAQANSLEVPAGTYKLKIDKQFIEDISVAAGETLVIE